jgi:cytochrome c oxidase subunit 4
MADSKVMSPTEIAEEHQKEAHAPYLWVWFWLLVFTLVEYFYAFIAKDVFVILLSGLLLVAAIKAGMVGWYFMHLKFEGKWVYALIIPAVILAMVLVAALSPDMAFRPEDEGEEAVEPTVWVAPADHAHGLRSPSFAGIRGARPS